ncbi:MAG: tetratricopeptide repeat protein [Methanobacterium sp.]|uniref:tetratricopeptide repeat protein n=1 Tax=Methanobacterium sp. TaxID=2164 RepID=UPI003D64AB27|nr:tetratricopeptide repeat protein [Methanobacterium sp.]
MVLNLFKRNKLRKLTDKGIKLRKEGKYEESIRYYDEAIELDPKFKYAWLIREIVYLI